MALLITPKESLNIPANTEMVTKPGTAWQNEDGADQRFKAQIFLVHQNGQQHAYRTLQRGSEQGPDHRPLQHVEEGRTPDGESEDIDEVLKPNPVHQLSRRRVIEVVVGKGDGKAEQDRETTTNTSRIKPGVIIRYGKPSLSNIWYCLRTLLSASPASRFLPFTHASRIDAYQTITPNAAISTLMIPSQQEDGVVPRHLLAQRHQPPQPFAQKIGKYAEKTDQQYREDDPFQPLTMVELTEADERSSRPVCAWRPAPCGLAKFSGMILTDNSFQKRERVPFCDGRKLLVAGLHGFDLHLDLVFLRYPARL